MTDESYMTNPDAQQGESSLRKSSRAPANSKIQPSIPREESVDEGPVPVPEHHGAPSAAKGRNPAAPQAEAGRTMRDRIGR